MAPLFGGQADALTPSLGAMATAQWVERLPSMDETLCLIHSTAKTSVVVHRYTGKAPRP